MTEPKLEPLACPFCGGEANDHRDSDGDWEVFCSSDEPCTADVAHRFPTREQAIAAWNARTPPSAEPTEAQVEAAAAALYTSWANRTYGKATVSDSRWEKQWPQQDGETRAMWCADARAALRAAPPSVPATLAPGTSTSEAPIAGMSLAEIEALANDGCNWCGGRKRVLLAMVERIREMEAKTAAAKLEALEQAAKVADAEMQGWIDKTDIAPSNRSYAVTAATRVAHAIRALSPSQPAEETP